MSTEDDDLTTYVTDPDGEAEGFRVIGGAVLHFDGEGRARVRGMIRWSVWQAAERLGLRVHTRRRAAAPANTAPAGTEPDDEEGDGGDAAEPAGS